MSVRGPSVIPPTTTATSPAITKSARAFEAVFLGQMTQLMMSSVESEGEISGGNGEEMFRGILAERVGDAIAQRGGIGLSSVVMAEMIKMQGGDGNGQ